MEVTRFRDVYSHSGMDVDLFKVLDDIKSSKYLEIVNRVRYADTKDRRDIEKKKLPIVTFGGRFKSRSKSNLVKSSGIACLDFDGVEKVLDLKNIVNNDDYTFSSFISPSGNGLKVLVKIPPISSDAEYKQIYKELQRHYDSYAKTDDSTSDISRATFVSHDPYLFLNQDSLMFTDRFVKEITVKSDVIVPITDMDDVANRLLVWFNKKWTSGINRNNNLFVLCCAFNDYGVDKSVAVDYCMNYLSEDFREQEIESLVSSAYKNTANFGSKKFEDSKIKSRIHDLSFIGTSLEDIAEQTGVGLDVVSAVQDLIPEDKFWDVSDKGRVVVSSYRFDTYLANKGISKYYQDKSSEQFDFVIKDNHFINWISPNRIKDIIKDDLITKGHIDVWDHMASSHSKYFSKDTLSMIDTIDVDYKKDDKNTSYIYYRNGVVKTVANKNPVIVPYDEIGSLVWRNQVKDRDIVLNDKSDGEFSKFIWKISGEDSNRYYTLKSVIGYLLHSYQSESKPKTVIFNDEMISDGNPNGGSGKGLIHKAIGKLKNIVVEDGKKFDAKMQFAYQRVRRDTQIFLLDDVNKNFNFENLFSVVTEGMTVEYKGKDAFTIPFSDSPKLSVTTNYTVKGAGPSFARRVFEVEIANYFNDKHTPEDEFGHQFFHDWSEDEWAKFDNFMIRCIKYFLENGLVESRKVNLEFRKFKDSVGEEFIEFMGGYNLSDLKVSRKQFRDDFNNQYKQIAKFNTAQSFNKKVKEYCDFHGLLLDERKNGGVVMFLISKQ